MKAHLVLMFAFGLLLGSISAYAMHSGPGQGGVALERSGLFANASYMVGEKVCWTLTAKDENGNVIRSWDQIGTPTTITLKNSMANTDSSMQSWNADPEGYTWAIITHNDQELTKISADEWSIHNNLFVDGKAEICLVHTRADTGVYLEISPMKTFLNQVTDPVDFYADDITNYLVDIFPSTGADNQVFHQRAYELWVSPRDRYMNPSDKTIRTLFSARWPGEFDNTTPGLSEIFSGEVFLTGETNYLLASRIIREKPTELQWVKAYSAIDPDINGRTDPYEILSHAPNAFALQTPVDHAIIPLERAADLQDFTWTQGSPVDPYTDIQVFRDDPSRRYTDDVTYTWVIVDSISLTNAVRVQSDNTGMNPKLTLSHGQLQGIMYQVSGVPTTARYQCLWYVEATDGLYITKSDPSPGHYLTIVAAGITGVEDAAVPGELALEQNYPNPFNPSTSISFATSTRGPVLLRVFDLVGSEVATLVDETMDAGSYSVAFDASGLPSGVYMYRLEAEGAGISKRMVLMK